jgi:hypothetical protein
MNFRVENSEPHSPQPAPMTMLWVYLVILNNVKNLHGLFSTYADDAVGLSCHSEQHE